MLTTAVSNNLAETEQINFRLWAGGQFTLRKPLCAYGLIAQPVQLSALPGRAPTNRPSPPRSGLFLFRAASVGGLFHFRPSVNVAYWHIAAFAALQNLSAIGLTTDK